MNAARKLVKKNEMMKIVETAKKKYETSGKDEAVLNEYLEEQRKNYKINRRQVIMITDLIVNGKGLKV